MWCYSFETALWRNTKGFWRPLPNLSKHLFAGCCCIDCSKPEAFSASISKTLLPKLMLSLTWTQMQSSVHTWKSNRFWFLPLATFLLKHQEYREIKMKNHLSKLQIKSNEGHWCPWLWTAAKLEESIGFMVEMTHGQEPREVPKEAAGWVWAKQIITWMLDCWISKWALIEALVIWNTCKLLKSRDLVGRKPEFEDA